MPLFARFMLSFLLLAVGCSDSKPPPLKIGINPWVGYDPLLLLNNYSITYPEIQIIELISNSESARALQNGLLDGAALTLDEALRLIDAGTAIKIVAVLDTSQGADAVLSRPEITSPAQLKGKRIAVEQTALGALMLHKLLKVGNLKPEDVKTIQFEAALHVEALKNGLTDAVISFEPMKSQLLKQGFHCVFDSSQIPGEIIDVLVVKASIEPERTTALLLHWAIGLQSLQRDYLAAAAILAPGTDLNQADYLQSLQGLHFVSLQESLGLMTGVKSPLSQNAEGLVATLTQLALLKQPPRWNEILDIAPVRLALQMESQP